MPLQAVIRLYRRLTSDVRLATKLELMSAAFSFLRNVTALTGGGASALDGVDTTLIAKPYYAKVHLLMSDGVTKQMQGWICRTRVGESESAPGTANENFQYVLPDNWHATTNNVIWERVE